MGKYFFNSSMTWKLKRFPSDHPSMSTIRSIVDQLPNDESTQSLAWASRYPRWSIDLARGDGLSFEAFEKHYQNKTLQYQRKQQKRFVLPSVFEKHAVELDCPMASEFLERSHFEVGQVLGDFDSESLKIRQ